MKTKVTNFRLDPETLNDIEYLKTLYGTENATEAVKNAIYYVATKYRSNEAAAKKSVVTPKKSKIKRIGCLGNVFTMKGDFHPYNH